VDARDHQGGDLRVELADRQIVQEEQRIGSGDQDVVDAMIDQIAADRLVASQRRGDEELRADAVGRTNQSAFGVAGKPEEPLKPPSEPS